MAPTNMSGEKEGDCGRVVGMSRGGVRGLPPRRLAWGDMRGAIETTGRAPSREFGGRRARQSAASHQKKPA